MRQECTNNGATKGGGGRGCLRRAVQTHRVGGNLDQVSLCARGGYFRQIACKE